jgi:hypothetical protein
MTASCFVGQSPYNPVVADAAPIAPMAQGRAVVQPVPARPDGFLSRVRSFFHRERPRVEYAVALTPEPVRVVGAEGVIQTSATVMVQGDGSTNEPPLSDGMQDVSFKIQVPPLAKKYREHAGYGEDFKWITGQLCRVHTFDTALWVVRYASLGQIDKYGGSVVLAPAVDMKNFREGDLVCIEGEVLKDRKAPGKLGGALYRANSISMITRGEAETK